MNSIGIAPAKIILFGEHAVVYGRAAIAVPVTQVCATVTIAPSPQSEKDNIHIQANEIHLDSEFADLEQDHPLASAIRAFQAYTGIENIPACNIEISSTIPVASGMGSGAAVSVALFRALADFLKHSLSDEEISRLTFEIEKIHHGTPSGIDNTVIAYQTPVYFIKGEAPQTFNLAYPLHIVIGDSGVASPTAITVGDVRHAWQVEPHRFEAMFDAIGEITCAARRAIEEGQMQALGQLMNDNHAILRDLGVSSPELEKLVKAARKAGALGAKLSGGGRGGNMIALAPPSKIDDIAKALSAAGARRAICTIVK
ncbi:MAG: mevalonate kinase [Anaerolineales bacterium]|nr:mevalonate kinase [Anaerolineales bacterium]